MGTLLTRLLSLVAHAVGVSVRVPGRLPGSHAVSSLHHRLSLSPDHSHAPYAQIFYPAAPPSRSPSPSPSPRRRSYARSGVATGLASFANMPKWLFHLFMDAAEHHLEPELTPSSSSSKLPVLVFMHGLGGNCDIYATFCSFVASFGYVVVALESEDGSGSFAMTASGGVVEYRRPPNIPYTRDVVVEFRAPFLTKRSREVRSTLEYLAHVVASPPTAALADRVLAMCDLDRVFLGGHSFGAAASVVAHQDVAPPKPLNIRGLVLLDIWSYPLPDASLERGVTLPYVSVLSDPFVFSPEFDLTRRWTSRSPWTSTGAGNWRVPGSVHSSFSDAPFWLPWSSIARRLHLRGERDPTEVLESTALVCAVFLREHSSPSPTPASTSAQLLVREVALGRGLVEAA